MKLAVMQVTSISRYLLTLRSKCSP